jgi:hypothetical protein
MPNITGPVFALPSRSNPGSQAGVPAGMVGELTISEVLGKYATLTKLGKVFYTSAIITAPVIFSTAAQLGPMLWNRPGSGVDAHILMVSVGSPTTASTVAGAISWASNTQATVPTTATSLTVMNAYAGGGVSAMGGVFSTATILVAPTNVPFPLVSVNTGAITTGALTTTPVDLGGVFQVPPGSIGYVCGNATLTAGVFTIGLMWAELPV